MPNQGDSRGVWHESDPLAVARRWATGTANLSSFAGQTIRIRIEAADASTGSLIEAGVDNVSITQA